MAPFGTALACQMSVLDRKKEELVSWILFNIEKITLHNDIYMDIFFLVDCEN